jgi:UDP-glucose 4-epimerase
MSKIIIFGSYGFVGQSLVQLLEDKGEEYLAHSSKNLDLTESSSIQKIADTTNDGDTIVMLSALTPERGEAGEITIQNITMIQTLLKGIEDKNIKQFIYVSSDAVYPMTDDIIDENTPPQPHDLYGCMHVMREQFLKSSIAPKKLTILRPCSIYGKKDTHNGYSINRFLRSALENGEISLFGNGEEYRDHIYIDDFTNIIYASHKKHAFGVFNVASGTSWRFIEIAEYIQSILDKKIIIKNMPRGMDITHRHMNTVKLCSIFPEYCPRAIDTGIKEFLKTLD